MADEWLQSRLHFFKGMRSNAENLAAEQILVLRGCFDDEQPFLELVELDSYRLTTIAHQIGRLHHCVSIASHGHQPHQTDFQLVIAHVGHIAGSLLANASKPGETCPRERK